MKTCNTGYKKVGNECKPETPTPTPPVTPPTPTPTPTPPTPTPTPPVTPPTPPTPTCQAHEVLHNGVCKKKTETCTISHGSGEKTFNTATGTYGACTLKNCNPGFHKEGNSCESDTRACIPAIPNSRNAIQTWNATTNTWNACQFECNAGYTKVGNVCKKDESQFQCPTNLPRLNVTLPTDHATRSAWVEKVKGLKFLKAQTQDPHAGITFLMSERQEGINNVFLAYFRRVKSYVWNCWCRCTT